MWLENEILAEDMQLVAESDAVDWNMLRNSSILVTGATGMIGQNLINSLLFASAQKGLHIRVLALVRDRQRAGEIFEGVRRTGQELTLVEGTVEHLPELPSHVDYIVHGASVTSSRAFVESPAEVLRTAVDGTENLLEYARNAGIRKMVFLSSMEVYGYPEKGHRVSEREIGALPPTVVRNCYPLSKQICESFCCAYASEYAVPVCVGRLIQTFGPGVQYHDGRVFAEFARAAIEKRDIVLKTRGETERSYLYTAEAVLAILILMLKGQKGEAYNIANEGTYCSIADMAELVAKANGVHVRYELQDVTNLGYANTLYMDLNTEKIRKLGWAPRFTLSQMYDRLIRSMKVGEKENGKAAEPR